MRCGSLSPTISLVHRFMASRARIMTPPTNNPHRAPSPPDLRPHQWKLRKSAGHKSQKGPNNPRQRDPPLSVSIKKEMLRFRMTRQVSGGHAEDFANRLTEHLIQRLPTSRVSLPLVTKWVDKYAWIQAPNGIPPGKQGPWLVSQIQAERPPESHNSPAGSPHHEPRAAAASPGSSPTSKRPKVSKTVLAHRLSTIELTFNKMLELLQRMTDVLAAQLGERSGGGGPPPTRPVSPTRNVRPRTSGGATVKEEIAEMINKIRTQDERLSRRKSVAGRQRRRILLKVEPDDPNEVQIIEESDPQFLSVKLPDILMTSSTSTGPSTATSSSSDNLEPSTSSSAGGNLEPPSTSSDDNNGEEMNLAEILLLLQSRMNQEEEELGEET